LAACAPPAPSYTCRANEICGQQRLVEDVLQFQSVAYRSRVAMSGQDCKILTFTNKLKGCRCGEMADAQDLKFHFGVFPVFSPHFSDMPYDLVNKGRNRCFRHPVEVNREKRQVSQLVSQTGRTPYVGTKEAFDDFAGCAGSDSRHVFHRLLLLPEY
jgi:hypothetical protein